MPAGLEEAPAFAVNLPGWPGGLSSGFLRLLLAGDEQLVHHLHEVSAAVAHSAAVNEDRRAAVALVELPGERTERTPVGAAEHKRARARAGERTVFGRHPIGAEQAIQHPLARLHARIAATGLLVHRAAARFDSGADLMEVAAEANMTKVLSADLLFDAADHAMQTLGASAWDEREGMIDLYLDARAARSAPISQELALNFIAQHVLGLPSRR